MNEKEISNKLSILKSILSLIITFKKVINQNNDNIIDNKDKICINHLKTLLNGYYELKKLIRFD